MTAPTTLSFGPLTTFVAGIEIGDAPTSGELVAIAADLTIAAELATAAGELALRSATVGEELIYELATTPSGPSLYLVSDGIGVAGAPHEHGTWAIIVGIRGREANRLYARVAGDRRNATYERETVVGPGEAFVLPADAIHSTHVVGDEPTYHLHLYGRPLRELPPYATRCFVAV